MSDQSMIAPEVPQGAVHPSARIIGQCRVSGVQTRIGAGAIIRDSVIENAVVEAGASVSDSVVIGTGAQPTPPAPTEFLARWCIERPVPPVIGEGASVERSTLLQSSVGARSRVLNAAALSSVLGPDGYYKDVYLQTVASLGHVRVEGPTEVCGAFLGHHAVIDRCGYLEGVFSNDFHVIEFDEADGLVHVRETLDVPHVGRFGMNTINSDNSGNLLDPPGGELRSLGAHVGLWHDPLLSHEPLMLGPVAWVSGWTKVIGKSARLHSSADELLRDTLSTNLLPFSVTGISGAAASGQVSPGELFDGGMYKQRHAGWTFTYAPGAVIGAVRRMVEAGLDPELAGSLPKLALNNAIALVRYYARERGVDIGTARPNAKGWTGWLRSAEETLRSHAESGLWDFEGGEPVAWREEKGKWLPRKPEVLLAIAPDAIENQRAEEDILRCDMPELPRTLGATPEDLAETLGEPFVAPGAKVAPGAFIGPGTRVEGESVVEDGAYLVRALVRDSNVGAGAKLARCSVVDSDIGSKVSACSSLIRGSKVAAGSEINAGRVEDSTLGGIARMNPYGLAASSDIRHPCIIGSNICCSKSDSLVMSYHMPGQVEHLVVEPTPVTVDGRKTLVRAIPMLGGGCRVKGLAGREVRMACSFIGSNAVIEAGAYVGFGSFVLGTLTGDEGLPPFTVSTCAGPKQDTIGMVAHSFANIVITHFISWAFQALGPGEAEAVARLVPSMLEEGRDAVAWAIGMKAEGAWDESSPFARYKSLRLYSDAQLASGLAAYEANIADGRWRMEFDGKELRFTGNGVWQVAGGAARWQPN